MVKEGERYCDVCASEIPRGEKYSVRTMPAAGAALLLDVDDPDLIPTWTQNPDGTVRLDICTTCYLYMGGSGDLETQ
ncbi:MAG: hypothetical protein HY721_30570 [Planctomycetes bacterium]|nr:hypothetical protein [Planctomycetota bacterium]